MGLPKFSNPKYNTFEWIWKTRLLGHVCYLQKDHKTKFDLHFVIKWATFGQNYRNLLPLAIIPDNNENQRRLVGRLMIFEKLQFSFYIRGDLFSWFFPTMKMTSKILQKIQWPLWERETQFVHLQDDLTKKWQNESP